MNTGKESQNTTHITALRLHPLREKSTNCKRKSVPVHLAVNIENFLCKIKKSKIQEKKEAKEMPRRKADSCSSSYTRYALTINTQIPSTINIEDVQVIKRVASSWPISMQKTIYTRPGHRNVVVNVRMRLPSTMKPVDN